MKAAEFRKLIGKEITWEYNFDRHRGICSIGRGFVEDVYGRNVMINGDWKWGPNMANICVIEQAEPLATDSKNTSADQSCFAIGQGE